MQVRKESFLAGVLGVGMKKRLVGWKTPRFCSSMLERRVRQKPVQLDLFGLNDFYYYEGRMFYGLPKEEDVSQSESQEL